LALVGLSDEIRDTMSMTGFLDFFVLTTTLEEAVQSVKEARSVSEGAAR
jgi:anti-anti-sigma regulatory factor